MISHHNSQSKIKTTLYELIKEKQTFTLKKQFFPDSKVPDIDHNNSTSTNSPAKL